MRSLADQPVTMPLPVTDEGRPLNDPLHPYWGRYEGDENTRRKPAYHNGTAWCLQMPLYCEALYLTYGESAREAAGAILGTAAYLMGSYCLGQMPEILDGSAPHTQRGCWAQAWSVTECRRVLEMLK
jgi:glycogen debranching enzyme